MFRGLYYAYYLNFYSLNFLAAICFLLPLFLVLFCLARPPLEHYTIYRHRSVFVVVVVVVVKRFWIEPFLQTNNIERRYSSLHRKTCFRLDLYILCVCTTLTKPMQIITTVTDVTVLERFHEKKSHFTA